MTSIIKKRNCVKIILLNEKDEIPLMLENNPNVLSVDGIPTGEFYTLIGGGIEEGETVYEAAARELHEEAGIIKENVQFGPAVWFGEFEIILYGIRTHFNMTFIVARTKKCDLSLANLTESEKSFVKEISWFSLAQINNIKEVVYPLNLQQYLPDIIAGNYPKKPLFADLTPKNQLVRNK